MGVTSEDLSNKKFKITILTVDGKFDLFLTKKMLNEVENKIHMV
jgi:hypothetical protein